MLTFLSLVQRQFYFVYQREELNEHTEGGGHPLAIWV
jgi:hypothetical protein